MMVKQILKIDLVSDVVCPWCAIGYKRLEKTLDILKDDIEADITWHPFQLNPHIPEEGENLRAHLAAKYGTTLEGSIKARANITELGAQVGFTFNYFDEMKTYNTFNAHQVLHYAHEKNKQTEMQLRLLSAFFGEREDIGQTCVLAAQAAKVGLDEKEVLALLEDQRYAGPVREAQQFWLNQGVHAVPTFVFNKQSAISGAYDVETLTQVINEAAKIAEHT